MKRKVVFALFVICLLLLAGVGVLYASGEGFAGLLPSTQGVDAAGSITQAVASTGDLTVSASGTGELVPVSQVALGFRQAGRLSELNVAPGTAVKAGDVLARLQVNRTEAELANTLASANLEVVIAQGALEALYATADKTRAEALLRLEQAQIALDDVQDNSLALAQAQQAVAEAGQAIEAAQMQLAIMNARPSQQARQVAYSSLLFKEKELRALDEQITRLEYQVKSAPDQNMKDRLRQQLSNLRIKSIELNAEVDKRQAAYDSLDAPADADELRLAEAKLVTAQAQLAQAQREFEQAAAGPSAGDIAQAQAELAQAQAEWQRLESGTDPQEVVLAEARLAAAQRRLAQVQQNQLFIDLIAPMDGVVVSIDAEAGDRLAAGNFLTLADMSQPMLEINLDESDYNAVQPGYRVQVVFDAYPDTTLTGEVVQVYPSLTTESIQSNLPANLPGMPPDVVMIQDMAGSTRALVRLDGWPPTPASIVPLGFTASVEVISAQASDALLVPVVALHEDESGGYAVYVVEGDELELRPVTVGLQDYTSAQILSGLNAGEAVSLDEVAVKEGEQ